MADCCLVPQVRFFIIIPEISSPSQVFKALRFNVDMTEFPVISSLYERLSQLQPFIAAHPENQIDFPQES